MSPDTATCVVVANGGNTPRAASSIVYTVAISNPGQPSYTVDGIKPTGVRFPDAIDTVPAPVGSTWPCEIVSGRTLCFIAERPDLAECP